MSTIYNPFSPELVAVSRLTAMGFVGRRLGEFDAEPESLVYIRQLKVDIRDLVRVVDPTSAKQSAWLAALWRCRPTDRLPRWSPG